MTRFRLALAAALCALALGCTQNTVGPPSPEFKRAAEKYNQLIAKDGLTEVFNDPDLPAVLALLDRVPADSVNADAAKKLRGDISAGMAEAQKTAAARAAVAVEAAKPTQGPTLTLPEPEAPPTPVAAATDAGAPPVINGPTPGMSAAEFQSKFGACFNKDTAFVDDKGVQGDAYVLVPTCAAKYPALATQMVLVAGGKVTGLVPQSAIVSRTQLTLGKATTTEKPPPPPPAPVPQPQEPPPPPNPNTIDRGVQAPENQVNVPSNLNSELDARTKLPGQ